MLPRRRTIEGVCLGLMLHGAWRHNPGGRILMTLQIHMVLNLSPSAGSKLYVIPEISQHLCNELAQNWYEHPVIDSVILWCFYQVSSSCQSYDLSNTLVYKQKPTQWTGSWRLYMDRRPTFIKATICKQFPFHSQEEKMAVNKKSSSVCFYLAKQQKRNKKKKTA